MRGYGDEAAGAMAGKSLPPTTHSFSTRVIQNLWTVPVENGVRNLGKSGGLAVEKMGKPAAPPHNPLGHAHRAHTPGAEKRAATWEYDVLPSVHSPYYYYVLITQ
jgi:hypothetical protein